MSGWSIIDTLYHRLTLFMSKWSLASKGQQFCAFSSLIVFIGRLPLLNYWQHSVQKSYTFSSIHFLSLPLPLSIFPSLSYSDNSCWLKMASPYYPSLWLSLPGFLQRAVHPWQWHSPTDASDSLFYKAPIIVCLLLHFIF